MKKIQKTCGEFIDSISETKNPRTRAFLSRWEKLATKEQWRNYRLSPLGFRAVLGLAEDAVNHFRRIITGTEDRELHISIEKDARSFLREICEKSQKLGVLQINLEQIDACLTLSEMIDALIVAALSCGYEGRCLACYVGEIWNHKCDRCGAELCSK